jgi:hypothetical protein
MTQDLRQLSSGELARSTRTTGEISQSVLLTHMAYNNRTTDDTDGTDENLISFNVLSVSSVVFPSEHSKIAYRAFS